MCVLTLYLPRLKLTMLKSLTVILFTVSLLFSLLAPSFLNLLSNDEIAIVDFAGEESQKESEISFGEDIKLIFTIPGITVLGLDMKCDKFHIYQENTSIHTSVIHLPPPKSFI
jgi:hypothetical protein